MTLNFVWKSFQDHVKHCVTFSHRKPLEMEAWFQRTTNRK